jgi:tape measure domain-containing protein
MVLRDFLLLIGVDLDESSLQAAQSRIDSFGARLGRLGTRLSIAISAPIAAATTYALKAASDIEQAHVAFEVFLGDANQAKKVMKDLIDFAVNTPFTLKGVIATSNMLMAMGESGNTLIKTLQVLGDVSRGRQDLLSRVALAYGQIMTAGKLRGQELRQLTEAGVVILPELSRLTGIPKEDLASRVSDYNISADVVRQALINVTSEGGRYFKLMEKMMQTIGGVFSNLIDSLYVLSSSFGSQIVKVLNLGEAVKKFIAFLNKLNEQFLDLDDSQKKLILGVTALLLVLGPLMVFLSTWIKLGTFVISTIRLMSASILGLQAGLGSLLVRVLFIPGAIMAAMASIFLLIDELNVWMKGGDTYLGDFLGPFSKYEERVNSFYNKIKSFYENFKEDLKILKDYVETDFITPIKDMFTNLFNYVHGLVEHDIEKISESLENMGPIMWKLFSSIVNGLAYVIMTLWDTLVNVIYEGIKGLSNIIFNAIADSIASAGFSIWKLFNKQDKDTGVYKKANKGDYGYEFKKAQEEAKKAYEEVQNHLKRGGITAFDIASAIDFLAGDFKMTPKGIVYTPANFAFKNKAVNDSAGVQINNDIKVTVPPGTQQEQVKFIEEATDKIVKKALDAEWKKILSGNEAYSE